MTEGFKRIANGKSEIVRALPRACSDETAAVEFIETQRWGNSPACPKCGVFEVYKMTDRATGQRNRRFLWRCHGCKKQFTVRTGTVFEESLIPLRHWCYAFWAACASKKGVSAKQIQRQTGITYKSALFMMHRIRFAMADDLVAPAKMTGTVEVDETWVGGKPRYRGPWNPRGTSGKQPVVALVQRGGDVRSWPIERVTAKNLKGAIRSNVEESARIMTDEGSGYSGIGKEFRGGHETVCHRAKEYARGDATVNTAESFFALVKRGLYGTFHSVSRKHLHRYLAEFGFRWNTRKMEDGARTGTAIRRADGKRLFYHEPVAG